MDLSWSKGFCVNDAIHKCKYVDPYCLDPVGPETLLYEVDISRAFRHICIDSGNIDLLGLHH